MAEKTRADVGLIGLAVMGQNLALNMADHGFRVAVFNRTSRVMRDFIDAHPNTPGGLVGCENLADFLGEVKAPRKIVILVKAGPAVDIVVKQLIEAGLAKEDLLVDCGNSQWTDTIRREKEYSDRCRFFGSGVSGGEIGARFGPSLMPGGDAEAWKLLEPIWTAIAAKVDAETGKPIESATPGHPVTGGVPCSAYIGENGAGHYVKMIHNGIEYIDMQLIGEAYFLLRNLLDVSAEELSQIFARWNEGDLDSYLIEITADILKQRDPDHPEAFLVDSVLDSAQQKGTGKWTSINALDMGIPANSIAEAVFARCLSALKSERAAASRQLTGPVYRYDGDRNELDPKRARCLVLLENLRLRAGFSAHEGGRSRVWMETGFRFDREHLARRLHHSGALFTKNYRRLCARFTGSSICYWTRTLKNRFKIIRCAGALSWHSRRRRVLPLPRSCRL